MRHLALMLLLAVILGVFFALVYAEEGKRLRYALYAVSGFALGALALGFLMYPFS